MYKVLSLDGGGIGGLYTASLLNSWEDAFNIKAVDYFDLIVGTSTGGIIALGLGAGMTGEEIVDFYKNQGPKIFKTSYLRRANQLFRNKYKQDGLRKSLEIAFGDKLFGHSLTRIVIPAVDLEEMRPRVYKTAHHERFLYDYKKRL